MIIQPAQFFTQSLRNSPWGYAICNILAAGINAANAETAVRKHVSRELNNLYIDNIKYDLNNVSRLFVVGAGKACVSMASSINALLGERITSGMVITKEGYIHSSNNRAGNNIHILEAGHPLPDQRNILATQQLISLFKDINIDDLIIVLISGGGSSLLMSPSPGISLQDVKDTTALLLKCGATIQEINTIRKHIDCIKGGGLARILYPANIISLILSDVVGDNLETIASGPTVGDYTTFSDAWHVLERYQLLDKIPHTILSHITQGMDGKISETIKPGDSRLINVRNIIVGSNQEAALNAFGVSKSLGFQAKILTTNLQGEASAVGQLIVHQAKEILDNPSNMGKPACLIAGGETTVTVRGPGMGGRNQELVLGSVVPLSGPDPMILISVATDGGDGPTDAAGAVATNKTYLSGLQLGLDPQSYLLRNDSYHYFDELGDLIKTGPTLTNVNDLVFVFGF